MALDMSNLLRDMGQPGRFQVIVYIMLISSTLPIAFNNLCMVFYGYGAMSDCSSNINPARSNSTTVASSTSGSMVTSAGPVSSTVHNLSYYNLEPGEWTIVAEWDLTCDRAYLGKLSTTIYFLGGMVGGMIVGFISDRFGRRPILLFSVFIQGLIGVGIALAPDFITFTIFRFFLGIFVQCLHSTSYAMKMEMCLPKYRNFIAAGNEITFVSGVMILGVISFVAKNWRYTQWTITATAFIISCYIWFVPESLRWLFLQERFADSEKQVERVTIVNDLPYPRESFDTLKTEVIQERHAHKTERKYTMLHLVKTPNMCRRSCALFYMFATSACYYGLILSITDLPGDKYMNYFVGGAFELLALFILLSFMPKFGRRKPLFVCFAMVGVACIVAGSVPNETGSGTDLRMVQTGFSLFGRCGASGLFCIIMIYASELFPTVIRTLGLGTSAVFLRLGGVLAPQILSLDLYTYKSVPMISFGVIALIGFILTFLLPETNNIKLPETIDDVEDSHAHEELKPTDAKI